MSSHLSGGFDPEAGEVVLLGDAEAFEAFARQLRASRPFDVPLEPYRGWEAIRPIAVLELASGTGPPTVRVSGDVARLAGGPSACAALADEIELFVEHNDLREPGMHAHISDGVGPSGQRVLAPGSCDLVLMGLVPDERA